MKRRKMCYTMRDLNWASLP